MLINSLNIPDNPKTEFFEMILFESDQKIGQRYCRADLSSAFQPLTC